MYKYKCSGRVASIRCADPLQELKKTVTRHGHGPLQPCRVSCPPFYFKYKEIFDNKDDDGRVPTELKRNLWKFIEFNDNLH